MFLIVAHQVCTPPRRDFGPLLFTETLNPLGFFACQWGWCSVGRTQHFPPSKHGFVRHPGLF